MTSSQIFPLEQIGNIQYTYWSCNNKKAKTSNTTLWKKWFELLTKSHRQRHQRPGRVKGQRWKCHWRLNILKVTAAKGLHSDIQKFKMLQVVRGSSYYGKWNSLPKLKLKQHIHWKMLMCIKSRQSEPKAASLEPCNVNWFSNIGQTERKLMTWTHDLN